MKIVLIGGKRITYYLAHSMIAKGFHLVIINQERSYCDFLTQNLRAIIIHGDGSRLEILKRAEIFREDIVVALTPRDQDNLIIAQLCKEVLQIDQVFTLVNDPENVEVFQKLDVDNILNITENLSGLIEQRISSHQITNLMTFEEGKAFILQVEIQEGFPVVGRRIKEIGLPKGALIGTLTRDQTIHIPHGEMEIHVHDRLLVICLPVVQTATIRVLTGGD